MGTTLARGIDRFVNTAASLWPPSRSAPDPPRKSRPRWPIIGAVSPSAPLPAPSARADALSARPRVSVVMAAYQAEQFLAEAIESALDQDYPAELVEVLVVDDGSTDATGASPRTTPPRPAACACSARTTPATSRRPTPPS